MYGQSGCVDAETEYLTPYGWKRIDQYEDGDMVLQFDPNTNTASFTVPNEYVKIPLAPGETLTHYTSKYGIDMVLSDEHRILYKTSKDKWAVHTSYYVKNKILELKKLNAQFSGTIATTFDIEEPKNHRMVRNLSEAELRLSIAVFAEGHFPNKSGRVRINLKHSYKKERLEQLLEACSYKLVNGKNKGERYEIGEYTKYEGYDDGYHSYNFVAPLGNLKEFPKEWYNFTKKQMEIVFDEVFWWDGQHAKGNRGPIFRTTRKGCADFVQFVGACLGWRSVIKERKGCYYVSFTKRTMVGFAKRPQTNFIPEDGYKYCFVVPSSFLVLRRNGHIFITGNSGKSLMSCTIAKNAQQNGYQVIYIDSEESLNTNYADKIGLDYEDPDKFLLVRITTLEELTKIMALLLDKLDPDEKTCFIIDSLTNLETEREQTSMDKGEVKNDMGLFAKRAKQIVKNLNNKIANRDAFMVCVNHTYLNQDPMNGLGEEIPAGGRAIIYIPSISLHLKKLKLKEGSEQIGIRCKVTIEKNRFGKVGTQLTINIPYETGMDPYDGVIDILVEKGVIKKAGGWYELPDGTKARKDGVYQAMDQLLKMV